MKGSAEAISGASALWIYGKPAREKNDMRNIQIKSVNNRKLSTGYPHFSKNDPQILLRRPKYRRLLVITTFFSFSIMQYSCNQSQCPFLTGEIGAVSAEILPLFKGELIVKAKLNNVDINILIDTGFSGTFWLSSTLIGAKGYVNIDNICIGRMCFSNVPSYA
jgi:hypothetical protein